MAAPLAGIGICIFDAYGTLFDFASAAARCPDVPVERRAALTALWRDKQVQYSWLRAAQGRHADFWQVTGEALDFALDALDLAAPGRRERLLQLYLDLEAFAEATAVLATLRRAGLRTAILSNGTPAMLAAVVAKAGMGDLLDAVLSVEEAGVFKPHQDVYRLATARFDAAPADLAFISSNGWDAHAAAAFGMRVAWCNRSGQPPERLPGKPVAEMASLAELPALLDLAGFRPTPSA
jgi:2-haloacid dehalogenase